MFEIDFEIIYVPSNYIIIALFQYKNHISSYRELYFHYNDETGVGRKG